MVCQVLAVRNLWALYSPLLVADDDSTPCILATCL